METNNKLIAEFLEIGKQLHLYENPITGDYEDELLFDTDWNWLMEAVDKIESFGYVFQLQGNSATFFKNKTFKEPIWNDSFIGNTKLKATYNAVVEFIKWYNEQ